MRRQRFKDGRVVVLGDLNVHFSELAKKNRKYEGKTERRILALLTSKSGLSIAIRNCREVPTHESGTIIQGRYDGTGRLTGTPR